MVGSEDGVVNVCKADKLCSSSDDEMSQDESVSSSQARFINEVPTPLTAGRDEKAMYLELHKYVSTGIGTAHQVQCNVQRTETYVRLTMRTVLHSAELNTDCTTLTWPCARREYRAVSRQT
jgi:hypothetical protein